MTDQVSFDAILPKDMAVKAEALGVKKANLEISKMFMLAVLAGGFILRLVIVFSAQGV